MDETPDEKLDRIIKGYDDLVKLIYVILVVLLGLTALYVVGSIVKSVFW